MRPEEKVFLAYFEAKKLVLYFNQLKELTKLSDSSLTNTLKKLLSQKILLVNKTKSNTFYEINNKKLFSLKFAEIALLKFHNLNIGVRVPLQNFSEKAHSNIYSIILFGSASNKNEKKGSDIDLLIVSDGMDDFSDIKKQVEVISNYPLNIFSCSSEEFIEGTDYIIIQAKKTGFPIKGEQYFYEVLLDESS